MQEEKKPSRGKVMGFLAVSLVIQSLSSVFIKYAGTYETMSKEFIIFMCWQWDAWVSLRSCGSFYWNGCRLPLHICGKESYIF